jgi:hypothetical protein
MVRLAGLAGAAAMRRGRLSAHESTRECERSGHTWQYRLRYCATELASGSSITLGGGGGTDR